MKNILRKVSWENWGKLSIVVILVLVIATIFPNMRKGSSNYYADSVNMKYESLSETESYTQDYSNSRKEQDLKLIVTGSMNMETLSFEDLLVTIHTNINKYQGYIQNSSTYSYDNSARSFEAVIRIPANSYQSFVEEMKKNGNVTYYNESIDDITTEYQDLSMKIASLKKEEEKVLEFYDLANSLDELMIVEERLSNLRYEIESLETRIKNYDLLTNYSTLHLSVRETKIYSQTSDKFTTRIVEAFRSGWTNFTMNIEDFMVDFVYYIWQVLILVAIVVVIVIYKKKKKSKNQ